MLVCSGTGRMISEQRPECGCTVLCLSITIIKENGAGDKACTTKKKKAQDVTSWAFGGDEGDRTPYLLNAIQALSQVSYTPTGVCRLSTALLV